jgi:endonuclease/exonuclease/phosphatase family metal-dependent hydrolase
VTVGDPAVAGSALTVLAVHPTAPTDPEQWRADHAAVLAAAEASDPDLVVGDFNATLDHPPMRALADHGWRSVEELANEGWQPTWPSNGLVSPFGLPLPSLVQIDHVLVGPRLAALSTHTVEIPGTDHRAVVAEVARK